MKDAAAVGRRQSVRDLDGVAQYLSGAQTLEPKLIVEGLALNVLH